MKADPAAGGAKYVTGSEFRVTVPDAPAGSCVRAMLFRWLAAAGPLIVMLAEAVDQISKPQATANHVLAGGAGA
jgi:hypothetical protein